MAHRFCSCPVRVVLVPIQQPTNKHIIKLIASMSFPANLLEFIAPVIFNIIIHDLPKALYTIKIKHTCGTLCRGYCYTTLKKHTNKRLVNHVQKLYKSELNKLTAYMKVKEKITNHEHLSHSLLVVHVCYIDGVLQSKFPCFFFYRTIQYYLILCSQTKHLS